MIKYKKKEVTVTEYEPVIIQCDRCKRAIKDYEEFHKIRHHFGYGTEYDQDFLEADICETCLLEILKLTGTSYELYENLRGEEIW